MSMKLREIQSFAVATAAAIWLSSGVAAQTAPPSTQKPPAAPTSPSPVTPPQFEQFPPGIPWQWQPIKPLDQTVADVGPLSTSFRELQTDLRQPLGFSHVYRVPGSDDLLMRSSGGLVAVFPQSVYAQTRGGSSALVPPGTVYHIGLPPDVTRGASDSESSNDVPLGQTMPLMDRIGSRLEQNIESEVNLMIKDPAAGAMAVPVPLSRQAASPPGTTIVNDRNYRAQRIGELMNRAARAQSGSTVPAADSAANQNAVKN